MKYWTIVHKNKESKLPKDRSKQINIAFIFKSASVLKTIDWDQHLGLLIEIKSLSNQSENFIRVTVSQSTLKILLVPSLFGIFTSD